MSQPDQTRDDDDSLTDRIEGAEPGSAQTPGGAVTGESGLGGGPLGGGDPGGGGDLGQDDGVSGPHVAGARPDADDDPPRT